VATTGSQKPAVHKWGLVFGAGVAAGAALVAFWPRSLPSHEFEKDLVASHVHSLMTEALIDVKSTDRHTVKPWFQGKLTFSPSVVDLRSKGFNLLGGRLEFLEDHPVAALVYMRAKHVINVYVTSEAEAGPDEFDIQGFHASHFFLEGLNYWAISDLNRPELELFSRDFVDATEGKAAHRG
jgi:anti-sigma factor RsiW